MAKKVVEEVNAEKSDVAEGVYTSHNDYDPA